MGINNMRKIKLVDVTEIDSYDGECHHSVYHGITDWEEVSDDDFEFLTSNTFGRVFGGRKYIIIQQDQLTIADRIVTIKEAIDKEKKRRLADERKYQKENAAREAKKEAKRLEKERKQFETLKAKFEK